MNIILNLQDPKIQVFAKALGDSTRIKILRILAKNNTQPSKIAFKLDMTISAISIALSVLRQARLVQVVRQDGKYKTYSLNSEMWH